MSEQVQGYVTTVSREGKEWAGVTELADGTLVHTQAGSWKKLRTLTEQAVARATNASADAIALLMSTDKEDGEVVAHYKLKRREAERADKAADEALVHAAQSLRNKHIPLRDIAEILGFSYQYIGKITTAPEGT